MNIKDEHDNKQLCLNFLIACYFGQSNDLLDAAVSRAYTDMASRTLRCFKKDKTDIKKKWDCRYDASNVVKNSIISFDGKKGFNTWHEDTIKSIEYVYRGRVFGEGQAQKWLNMTIKYLYVFATLLDESDERLKPFKTFLDKTTTNDYYPPVDSYVLKWINDKVEASDYLDDTLRRSLMNKGDYSNLVRIMRKYKADFMWELSEWESLTKTRRDSDSNDSYAYYLHKYHDEADSKS